MRTPAASEAERGHQPEDKSKARGGQVTLSGQMMTYFPTPKARDSQPEGYEAGLRRATPQVGTIVKGLVDGDERVVLPTPMSRDYKGDTAPHERNGVVQTDSVERAIFHSGEVLLPTTRTSMKNGATAKEVAAGNPKFRLETVTNWGKFQQAITRWEETLGRPAPLPTKPDGKEGSHRLSSAFTEWMMGVPAGWITDVGLTRNEELKACGNGVVPQQAELALRVLLEGMTLPRGGGK
jgi:DNA (cytosine-5)-methyltransferase 1